MANDLKNSVFYFKMDNLMQWNVQKKHKFVQSIEFHCTLKKIRDHSASWIRVRHTLPFPIAQQSKSKLLFICHESDFLYNNVTVLMDDRADNVVDRKMYQIQHLVAGYIKSNASKHILFEQHIINICFQYYFSKQYEKNKIINESLKHIGLDIKTTEELKTWKRNKKIVKKQLNKNKYTKLFASNGCIRMIPRLIGPYLARVNKFPAVIRHNAELKDILHKNERTVSVKCRWRYQQQVSTLSTVIGNTNMTKMQLIANILELFDGILKSIVAKGSFTKKPWMYIKKINIKLTHGKAIHIYNKQDIVSRHELPALIKIYKKRGITCFNV
eukprot:341475_1